MQSYDRAPCAPAQRMLPRVSYMRWDLLQRSFHSCALTPFRFYFYIFLLHWAFVRVRNKQANNADPDSSPVVLRIIVVVAPIGRQPPRDIKSWLTQAYITCRSTTIPTSPSIPARRYRSSGSRNGGKFTQDMQTCNSKQTIRTVDMVWVEGIRSVPCSFFLFFSLGC